MDRTAFFDTMREEFGSLSQEAVDGTNALLDVGEERKTPMNHLAYVLATSIHETAFTMQPIAEYGKGQGYDYLEYYDSSETTPCKYKPQDAYGRGYVQLTWEANYERADEECGLGGKLIENFELALDPATAAEIIYEGMTEGWFTGKKLDDYCNSQITDYYNARRIVNGTDKASAIQGYAEDFEQALRAAKYDPNAVVPEVPESGVSPEDGEHPPESTRPPLPDVVISRIRYDYQVQPNDELEDEEFESHLNAMGARGWRLSKIDEVRIIWERPRR